MKRLGYEVVLDVLYLIIDKSRQVTNYEIDDKIHKNLQKKKILICTFIIQLFMLLAPI